VRTLAKLNMGTFCRVDSIKKSADGRLYALEDAYGNIKEFTEAQVISQMQLGVLHVINLELNENNKLIRKTPEALEVTESNIGSLGCFPLLVNVFDLTTEKAGTAVAIEYNKQDGSHSILNVVINGNMYEASMRPTLERNIKCKKSSCLACKERNADKCRYNRYGGGYKLCVEIGARHNKVAYDTENCTNELLAVAVGVDSNVKAYYEKYEGKQIWRQIGYGNFNDMTFSNTLKWGGVIQLDVPVIDWETFNKRREERLDYLENELKELSWRAVNEGYFEVNDADYEMDARFNDQETQKYWNEVEEEYKGHGGYHYHDITEVLEDYIKDRASEEGARLWWIEEWDVLKYYTVDPKGSFRGKYRMEKIYMDMKYDLIEYADCPEDKVGCNMDTNIFDNEEVEVEVEEE
jgi:hypothetical protein